MDRVYLCSIDSDRCTDNSQYRATARDVITHRNQYKIHFRMARLSCGANVGHTRATVTALLEILYKWMPLHLVYTIATIVCEETRRWPYKVSDQVSVNLPCGSDRKVTSSQSLYRVGLVYFGQLRKDSVISRTNEQH